MHIPNHNLPRLILISGGIGAGKSVVCKILRHMGYAVYDSDTEARRIMDNSRDIIDAIATDICREAIKYIEGTPSIHRPTLAQAVFSDSEKLNRLNALVHGAVKTDIMRFREGLAATGYNRKNMFAETAIPHSSGLDLMADETWLVEAPPEIRIARATQRDNATRDAIEARIASQDATESHICTPIVHTLLNAPPHPLLPQILTLLN